MFKRKILLPQTPEQFDLLVEKVCSKYSLQDKNHAATQIITAIKHLPHTQDSTTLDFLAGVIRKNLAYQVADWKLNNIKFTQHKNYVDSLEAKIVENPNDDQSINDLRSAVAQGSELAKEALKKLNLDGAATTIGGNVIPMGANVVDSPQTPA
jgi:GTP-binding protein EngB required for normal cell division